MTVEPRMLDSLIWLLDDRRPLRVLELGSGLSTVAMAYQIEKTGVGYLEALDHDKECAEQTREYLKEHGLQHVAQVHYAPIRNHAVPWDGMAYPWYSLSALSPDRKYDFVFVDGPPGNLGHMARWPAYFLLKKYLAPNVILVVDDVDRKQERVMVEHWLKSDPYLHRTNLSTGRGGVLLERKFNAKGGGEETEEGRAQEGINR